MAGACHFNFVAGQAKGERNITSAAWEELGARLTTMRPVGTNRERKRTRCSFPPAGAEIASKNARTVLSMVATSA
jgi:hypothetical protein